MIPNTEIKSEGVVGPFHNCVISRVEFMGYLWFPVALLRIWIYLPLCRLKLVCCGLILCAFDVMDKFKFMCKNIRNLFVWRHLFGAHI